MRFAQALAAGHQLELGEAVHGVNVVEPLGAILIALVDAVDANEAGAPIRGGSTAFANGYGVAPGLGPVQAGGLVAGLAAQVVQVRYREAREPLVAGIAKELPSALQQPFRGRPREGAMQRIGLREQLHVSGAELPGKACPGGAIAL